MSTEGHLGTARAHVRCGVDRDPIDEFGSLFTRDGERFVPTQLTRGPWDPNAMHGGAPSALMAHVLRAPRSRARVVHRPVDRRAVAAGAARTDAGGRTHVSAGQERAMGRSRAARRRRRGRACGRAPAAPATRRRRGDDLARGRDSAATRRGRAAAVRVLRPRSHRVLVRQRDPARRRRVRRRGPGDRVDPAEVPGRRRRTAHAVRTGRRGRRLRQRCRQPAHVHDRVRDQPRGDDPRPPAPGGRVGLSRVGRVGGGARRRPGGHSALRRARRARPRRSSRCSSRR